MDNKIHLVNKKSRKPWWKQIHYWGGMVIWIDDTFDFDLYVEWVSNDIKRNIQELRKQLELELTQEIYYNFYWPLWDKVKERFLRFIDSEVLGEYKIIWDFKIQKSWYFEIDNDIYWISIWIKN